jgi:hypothetical protein
MRANNAPCRFFDQRRAKKSTLGTLDREAGGNDQGAGLRSRANVFNVDHLMGRPTQTVPWRLLLLAAAHF